MSIENLMVTLYRVPEIRAVVDTGTDWVTLFGFLLTALAVVVGSLYTSYTFKRTIASQERIAETNIISNKNIRKAELVAGSRQEWINSLRSEIAAFLSVGHDIYASSQYIIDTSWLKGETQEESEKAKDLYDIRYSKFTDKLASARFHYAMVELLINPSESDSQDLIRAMNAYIDAASTYRAIHAANQSVVDIAQIIIKNEWVRVRDMMAP